MYMILARQVNARMVIYYRSREIIREGEEVWGQHNEFILVHLRYEVPYCQTLFFGAPKSLQMVIAAMKLKDAYSVKGKL